MTRRPNKPHRDGYEDEEDCEGHYDPDEEERRGCHNIMRRSPDDPCEICCQAWRREEERKQQEKEDAMTPDEKVKRDELIAGLRKLDAEDTSRWHHGKLVQS